MPTFAKRVGRYLDLEVQGVSYEVYFESAGNPDGIPLVLQHTAGSDGRQWRHQLEDERIGRHFHLLAYDLPYHAKSVPPAGVEWWKQEYRLTMSFLLDFVTAFVGELQLEDPVYMGSSIGGHLALDLALHRAGLFQAVIGLEAAIKSDPGNIDLLDHPEINNGYKGELMIGRRRSGARWAGATARARRACSGATSSTGAPTTTWATGRPRSIRRRRGCSC